MDNGKLLLGLIVAGVVMGVVLQKTHAQDLSLEEAVQDEINKTPGMPATRGGEQIAPPPTELPPAAPQAPSSGGYSSGSGGGDHNEAFEKRLFRIFKNAQPVSRDKWDEIVGDRRESAYNVQAGDTLWDISKTFFADGNFWSKLWAENGGLQNPHKITPGESIRFVAGNESQAPTLAVMEPTAGGGGGGGAVNAKVAAGSSEEKLPDDGEVIVINPLRVNNGGSEPLYREEALKELKAEELSSGNVIEVDELVPKPEIPPAKPRRPVMKSLPASFVKLTLPKIEEYDKTGMDAKKQRALFDPATIVPNSFIIDTVPTGVGRLTEVETGVAVASVGQNVFVRMSKGANPGDKFSVFFPGDKIEGGQIMEVGGTVEIIGPVNATLGVYRANVIASVSPIKLGSVVSEDPLPRVEITQGGQPVDKVAKILGGEFDRARRLMGDNSIVYLSGGERAGLAVGDILSVRASRAVRRGSSQYPAWNRPVGLLKVVKVERTVATAIVIQTVEEIRVGDTTGGMEGPERVRSIDYRSPK